MDSIFGSSHHNCVCVCVTELVCYLVIAGALCVSGPKKKHEICRVQMY
jgi:hypothetical protein